VLGVVLYQSAHNPISAAPAATKKIIVDAKSAQIDPERCCYEG
jgi:hypothetical protein